MGRPVAPPRNMNAISGNRNEAALRSRKAHLHTHQPIEITDRPLPEADRRREHKGQHASQPPTSFPTGFNCLSCLPFEWLCARCQPASITRTVIGSMLQRAMAVPFRPFHPAHRVGVGGRPNVPPVTPAQVIRDHVVVANPLAVAMNAVEEFDEFHRLDDQPGLFASLHVPLPRVAFPQFDQTAGNGPLAFQRLASAPDQQHAALVDNHTADANQRRQRKFSL